MGFYCSLFLTLLATSFCLADDDITRIAECRSQCLDKFLNTNDISFDEKCKTVSNCYQCWDSCKLLQENFHVWGPMCTDTQICFPGCVQACGFHFGSKGRGERDLSTKAELVGQFPQPLRVQSAGKDRVVLNWTPPHPLASAPPTTPLKFVYVILRRTRTGSEWQEIKQTSDLMAIINDITPGKKLDFKVMAVISSGVYASMEATYVADFEASQDDNKTASNKAVKAWNLSASLRTHNLNGKESIEATFSWNPPQAGEFMVVWEIIDNNYDVKGHMYTDTATTTLTLEKESVYRVYIQMVGANLKSESIEVDTSRVRSGPELSLINASSSDCTFKAVLLCISCVTLCLLLIFALWFCCWFRAFKSFNGCFPSNKRNCVTPLHIKDIECGQNTTSSETITPGVGIIVGSLEKLSHTLSPSFTDYVSDVKRLTPPPYEIHDSNPATPQVSNNCLSANRPKENNVNHIFKF